MKVPVPALPRPSARTRLVAVPLLAAVMLALVATPAFADGVVAVVHASLSVGQAVVLGLVEGLTEYLPISSTGHLIVTSRILGLPDSGRAGDALKSYEIAIQGGAILAVLLLYRHRFGTMIDGLRNRSTEGRQLLLALIAAFVPAAVLGLIGEKVIKDYLFGVPPVIGAWAVGGVLILVLVAKGVIDRPGGRPLESLTPRDALVIGFAQVVAMWPGTSRSMVTIVAALLLGYSIVAAVEFSFLLGVVTLGAATAYSVVKDGKLMVDTFGLFTPLVGFVVAFFAAVDLGALDGARTCSATPSRSSGGTGSRSPRSRCSCSRPTRSDRPYTARRGAGRRDHRRREQGGDHVAVRLAVRASRRRRVGDQGDAVLPPGPLRRAARTGDGVGRGTSPPRPTVRCGSRRRRRTSTAAPRSREAMVVGAGTAADRAGAARAGGPGDLVLRVPEGAAALPARAHDRGVPRRGRRRSATRWGGHPRPRSTWRSRAGATPTGCRSGGRRWVGTRCGSSGSTISSTDGASVVRDVAAWLGLDPDRLPDARAALGEPHHRLPPRAPATVRAVVQRHRRAVAPPRAGLQAVAALDLLPDQREGPDRSRGVGGDPRRRWRDASTRRTRGSPRCSTTRGSPVRPG